VSTDIDDRIEEDFGCPRQQATVGYANAKHLGSSMNSSSTILQKVLEATSASTIKCERYQGQVHSFMFNVKLLPKAYDAIDDVAAD
jgi:hypothetical protein